WAPRFRHRGESVVEEGEVELQKSARFIPQVRLFHREVADDADIATLLPEIGILHLNFELPAQLRISYDLQENGSHGCLVQSFFGGCLAVHKDDGMCQRS